MLNSKLIALAVLLIFASKSNAQGNLQEQFIQQQRIERENQRKHEQWLADVERQRAKDEAQRESYVRDLEKKALQDSVVYTCNDVAPVCAPQFRHSSGKCWGTIIRFKKGAVYVFPETVSPSLWNDDEMPGNFTYDEKSQLMSWVRDDNYIQYNLVLKDDTLYIKTNTSNQDIRKYSCKLTHGSKSSIFLNVKKSFRVLKYEDYNFIRKKLIAEGWKSFGNPYLDKSSSWVRDAIRINKMFGFYELGQCFGRGNNLFLCDTTWTSTGNKENPELFFGVLIDTRLKTALIEDDAVSE